MDRERKTGLHLTVGPRAGMVQLPTGMIVSQLWNATLRQLTTHCGHSLQSTRFELVEDGLCTVDSESQ